jgi:hypothetical protein
MCDASIFLSSVATISVDADMTVPCWFTRGEDFVRYEARQTAERCYELRFVDVDGTERIEQFDNGEALVERQRELESILAHNGWTGPHGWNV